MGVAIHIYMGMRTWKLDELAREGGVAARTVRYYVQRGLLPAPVFKGRDTVYSDEHLLKLRAIRKLQDRFLPLDAIQAELERASLDALRELVEGAEQGHPYRDPPPEAPRVTTVDTHLSRWVLAPGLELTLADDADAATRALADELRSLAHKNRGGNR
jgi:DNA-binding transcriptional MerR regulator